MSTTHQIVTSASPPTTSSGSVVPTAPTAPTERSSIERSPVERAPVDRAPIGRASSSTSSASSARRPTSHTLNAAPMATQNYADVEKDHGGNSVNGNKYDLHHETHDEDTALRRLRTAGSLSISPELFEKIYLSPKNQVSNNVRSTVGNPTPLALVGFLLCLSPLSNILMGWRGSGGLGAAEVGAYYFFGGLLMIVGSILEFILGNTFPFIVFGSFGAFWLTYAATLTSYYGAIASYQVGQYADVAQPPMFLATFGFFLVYMGLLCLVYLVCALRTNLVFIGIFATLVPAFGLLASVFWHGAQGVLVPNQQTAAGALTFITSLLGWYLFFVQCLAAVDFPLNLPVGDTSHLIKGASERKTA